MKGISVIICCYNSGIKLIPTLTHLANQQILPGINYEIVIVDNNCNDNTVEIVHHTWAHLDGPFPLTIVSQSKPGLNYAREMGIQTALYDYTILCDDDNWLCKDYLFKVYHLFEAMPGVALIGGVGEAISDVTIPGWFTKLEGFGYAVGAEGRQTGYVDSVYGAGMAIRKPVFSAIVHNQFSFILTDRTGKSLSSGGDIEISMLIINAGHKIYLDRSLTFKHSLSEDRLRWRYYLKLRQSFGKATAYLQLYNWSRSPVNALEKCSTAQQLLSLSKYAFRHLKYILFPSYFKNGQCAHFNQQMSMRITCILENKKIKIARSRIAITLKGALVLKHDPVQ